MVIIKKKLGLWDGNEQIGLFEVEYYEGQKLPSKVQELLDHVDKETTFTFYTNEGKWDNISVRTEQAIRH